jgi:hypothetical protein
LTLLIMTNVHYWDQVGKSSPRATCYIEKA